MNLLVKKSDNILETILGKYFLNFLYFLKNLRMPKAKYYGIKVIIKEEIQQEGFSIPESKQFHIAKVGTKFFWKEHDEEIQFLSFWHSEYSSKKISNLDTRIIYFKLLELKRHEEECRDLQKIFKNKEIAKEIKSLIIEDGYLSIPIEYNIKGNLSLIK